MGKKKHAGGREGGEKKKKEASPSVFISGRRIQHITSQET